jgi:hypothetical protein
MIVPERNCCEGTPEDASLREPNGDDDTTTKLQDDTVRANSFRPPIPHIPSPIVTPASLLHSSASSFAGGASNHNQSNRHSIHSGRNSILSERSPRPPSRASLASYDTDTQHPVQYPIRECQSPIRSLQLISVYRLSLFLTTTELTEAMYKPRWKRRRRDPIPLDLTRLRMWRKSIQGGSGSVCCRNRHRRLQDLRLLHQRSVYLPRPCVLLLRPLKMRVATILTTDPRPQLRSAQQCRVLGTAQLGGIHSRPASMATRIRILKGCPPSLAHRLEVGGVPPAGALIRSSLRGVSESLQVDQ